MKVYEKFMKLSTALAIVYTLVLLWILFVNWVNITTIEELREQNKILVIKYELEKAEKELFFSLLSLEEYMETNNENN